MGVVTVVLEWTFSPPDYFEEAITISRQDYVMVIDIGKVTATIPSATYDTDQSMRMSLHEALNDRLRGVQLISHRLFKLSNPTVIRVHPDGRRDISIELEGAEIKMTAGDVDFQITDRNGKVIRDSKRDRIEKKMSLAELVSAHRPGDSLLTTMLKSYGSSVHDPNNELVHLYEIRESLATHFGGEATARTALAVNVSEWSRLGQLCNNEPLRQGRHRGKSIGVLRDATESELSEARGIARRMIEGYLSHKSGKTSGT